MSLEGQLKSKIEQMSSQGMSFNNGGQQVKLNIYIHVTVN